MNIKETITVTVSGFLLITLLIACAPKEIPPITPIPDVTPTKVIPPEEPAPTETIEPDYTLPADELQEMYSTVEAIQNKLGVNLKELIDSSSGLPIYFTASNKKDSVQVKFNKEDFSNQTYLTWLSKQSLSSDWTDYKPTDIGNIWGIPDDTLGKTNNEGGFAFIENGGNNLPTLLIWLN